MTEPAQRRFCDYCGRPAAGADHAGCARARRWEPARYCERCGRRMVVQVLPRGWTGRCVQHGSIGHRALP